MTEAGTFALEIVAGFLLLVFGMIILRSLWSLAANTIYYDSVRSGYKIAYLKKRAEEKGIDIEEVSEDPTINFWPWARKKLSKEESAEEAVERDIKRAEGDKRA